MRREILSVGIFVLMCPFLVSAHGGGLDSSGGHNCRTGSCAGTYHCHREPCFSNNKPQAATVKPLATPTPPKETTYRATQYNSLETEKDALVEEKNTLTSEKETLIQDLENVKKELSTIKQEKEEKEKEISQLKKASEEKGILSTIEQAETTLVKPNEQASAKNNNSEGSGTIPFLLGSGLVYGAGRLKRKQEMKKEGVQIKGNITRDGQKIYYTINSRYYDMVKIDKKKGEKWFLSEAEATNAGWHKA